MKRDDFNKLRDSVYKDIVAINETKGKDYSGDEDALSNFKVLAQRLGMTPLQVWGVYALKHIAAIESYIKNGSVESEPIEGRIDDAILYLFLLRGLIEEENA